MKIKDLNGFWPPQRRARIVARPAEDSANAKLQDIVHGVEKIFGVGTHLAILCREENNQEYDATVFVPHGLVDQVLSLIKLNVGLTLKDLGQLELSDAAGNRSSSVQQFTWQLLESEAMR